MRSFDPVIFVSQSDFVCLLWYSISVERRIGSIIVLKS